MMKTCCADNDKTSFYVFFKQLYTFIMMFLFNLNYEYFSISRIITDHDKTGAD